MVLIWSLKSGRGQSGGLRLTKRHRIWVMSCRKWGTVVLKFCFTSPIITIAHIFLILQGFSWELVICTPSSLPVPETPCSSRWIWVFDLHRKYITTSGFFRVGLSVALTHLALFHDGHLSGTHFSPSFVHVACFSCVIVNAYTAKDPYIFTAKPGWTLGLTFLTQPLVFPRVNNLFASFTTHTFLVKPRLTPCCVNLQVPCLSRSKKLSRPGL